MKLISLTLSVATLLGFALLHGEPAQSAEPAKKTFGPEQKLWDDTVDKAIAYLKSSQAKDGSWSKDKSPGITGIVLTGLLETGKVDAKDPMVQNALKYIESLVNEKAGHIAGQDPKPQLLNYVTSVNVMALKAANQDKRYEKIIGNAADYLKKLQWDETHKKDPKDDFYGGAGYDSKSRPDLSNTGFFLDALVAAGVAKTDPAFQKALVFVSRCQNFPGEDNKMPWADKIKDGSFIYTAALGGDSKAEKTADGGLVGYGSMTYAGIKSMIYCGVPKTDNRMKKALEWIEKNYTVDFNPGMPKPKAQQGMYYYYHTMAKCLSVMGLDEAKDAKGNPHDWRAEITQALAKRQEANGSWTNAKNDWMEGDNNLVTGYALMTLSHCKPKK